MLLPHRTYQQDASQVEEGRQDVHEGGRDELQLRDCRNGTKPGRRRDSVRSQRNARHGERAALDARADRAKGPHEAPHAQDSQRPQA